MTIYIVIAILVILILLGIYIYKESTGFCRTSYEFTDNRLKCEEFKISLLSDLHGMEYGKDNCELLDAIEQFNPDIVCLAGDMITGTLESGYEYKRTLNFIEKLSKKYKIYYGIGNHEDRIRSRASICPGVYDEFSSRLEKMGAPIMINKKEYIERAGITVYSLNLDYEYFRKFVIKHVPKGYIKSKLGDADKEGINLLLAHNPDHFPDYSEWGADIVFAGHVHGGIIRLPLLGGVISPAMRLFPKYDGGKFVEGKSTMILSRGIGTHSIPVRINNKAEIIEITIRRS